MQPSTQVIDEANFAFSSSASIFESVMPLDLELADTTRLCQASDLNQKILTQTESPFTIKCNGAAG